MTSGAEARELRDEAVVIARAAGDILKARLNLERSVSAKDTSGVDLVTDADRASEDAILEALGRRFPDHAVLAEERGEVGKGTFLWLVDPLDGTVNYTHRVPHFCVSMAVEGPGPSGARQLLAGVVVNPMLGEVFAAAAGQGATLNGAPIRVSAAKGLSSALVCTGFPYSLRESPEAPLALFNRLVPRAQGVRRLGAAALDLAYLAAGRFDAFFEYGLKPWDTATGALLIQEAGGVIARLDGGPYDARSPDIVAATPLVAPELMAECAAFVAARS